MIFKTPEELQKKIDQYIKTEEKPTLAGLAYYLEIDRKSLYNYKERPEFFHIIKRATDYIESQYEQRLIYGTNPTGLIFALKNMGWSDKKELEQKTEHSGGITINWTDPV